MLHSADVELSRKDGSLVARLNNMRQHPNISRFASGTVFNSELVRPDSRLRKDAEAFLSHNHDARVHLGRMRVGSGGGVLIFPRSLMVDLSTPKTTHHKMLERVEDRLGSKISHFTLAPVRDWEAPGSYGVIDGGGTGRGESPSTGLSISWLRHCYEEMLGEVGLLAHSPNGHPAMGRYTFADDISEYTNRINAEIRKQWEDSHGGLLPSKAFEIEVKRLSLPDKILWSSTAGDQELANVKLAFELNNASLECMIRTLACRCELPEAHSCLRVVDLESYHRTALDRSIAVILIGEDAHHTAAIFYRDGRFDAKTMMVSVWGNATSPGNEKFDAIRDMLTLS